MSSYDVQFLIKSFLRPTVLRECLERIRQFYPYRIIVADDSLQFDLSLLQEIDNVTYHPRPFNSGLSAGRNHLVSQVTSQYFILLDHDHLLVDANTVEHLVSVANNARASIVCGLLWDVGSPKPRNYFGHFTGDGQDITLNHYDPEKTLYAHAMTRYSGHVRYCGCRYGANFMLGVTEDFHRHKIRWDDELKLMEHEDFFLRLSPEVRVTTTPDVWVEHRCCYEDKPSDPAYASFRYAKEHREKARAKYGLKSEFFLEKHGVLYDWTTWKFPEVPQCSKCSESVSARQAPSP